MAPASLIVYSDLCMRKNIESCRKSRYLTEYFVDARRTENRRMRVALQIFTHCRSLLVAEILRADKE